MRIPVFIAASFIALTGGATFADPLPVSLPMYEKGAATYYVQGQIDGYGATEFMVDTGSGYMTINEQILAALKQQKMARYLRDLQGVMTDGSTQTVPVYELSAVRIGSDCVISKVEAAVFPGTTRPILGLSALKRVAPFEFSIGPARLTLNGCSSSAI